MALKKACAIAGRALGVDPLRLYEMPVREIVEWCDVIDFGRGRRDG